MEPALALLEFNSIARGIAAADAMVKRAPVARVQSGTVQPGHYLVLVAGNVAEVEEAVSAGRATGAETLLDQVYLPGVHPDVVAALGGGRRPQLGDALGIVETRTVAAAIHAADAGVKGAEVNLLQLRLADGLGGKGLALFAGLVADVETAVALGVGRTGTRLVRQEVIPQLHAEIWPNVLNQGRFGGQFETWEGV